MPPATDRGQPTKEDKEDAYRSIRSECVADTARHDGPDPERDVHGYDRGANFSNYKTYAWTRGTELSDPLNHARVVRAIDAALVGKGLARVEASASSDVLVAYHASFDRNLEISGSAHGWGPLVSVQIDWGRRGFSRCWSERSSSTSPTHGPARSCGGAWPAATSGQRTRRRLATRRSRGRRRRCSRTTRRRADGAHAIRQPGSKDPQAFVDTLASVGRGGKAMSKQRNAGRVRSTYKFISYRIRRWSVGKPAVLIPDLLQRQFTVARPNKAWAPTSPTSGPGKAGSISRS